MGFIDHIAFERLIHSEPVPDYQRYLRSLSKMTPPANRVTNLPNREKFGNVWEVHVPERDSAENNNASNM